MSLVIIYRKRRDRENGVLGFSSWVSLICTLKTENPKNIKNIQYTGAKPQFNVQEAQLPQRNSASAAHVYLGWLTDRAMHRTPQNRRGCTISDIQTL